MLYGTITSGTAVSGMAFITNVNPITNKINNNELYKYWTDGSHAQYAGTFEVTDNSVTLSNVLSGVYPTYISLMYTFN